MSIINTFIAFNVNAFNQISFILLSNLYFFVLVGCAALTVFFSLKLELEESVNEEQMIL